MISSKNKKLVAVITLLCFMLTLFPTAAFAEASLSNGVLTIHNSETALSYETMRTKFGYGKTQLFRVQKNGTTVWSSADNYNDSLNVTHDDTFTVQKGTWKVFSTSWSNDQTFKVSVYDTVEIKTTKDGQTTTTILNITRGKSGTVPVAAYDDYNVTVSGAVSGTTAGDYTVSNLNKDATVSVVYVADTQSTVSVSADTGNATVSVPGTVDASSTNTVAVTPTEGMYVVSVTLKDKDNNTVSWNDGSVAYNEGVWSGEFTASATKNAYTIDVEMASIISFSNTELSFNRFMTAAQIKASIIALIDKSNGAVTDEAQISIQFLDNKPDVEILGVVLSGDEWVDLTDANLKLDGSNSFGTNALGEDVNSENLTITYISKDSRFPSGKIDNPFNVSLKDTRPSTNVNVQNFTDTPVTSLDNISYDETKLKEKLFTSVTAENETIGSADDVTVSVKQGEEAVSLPITLPGTYSVTFTYAENAYYHGSSNTATLVIDDNRPNVAVTAIGEIAKIELGNDMQTAIENAIATAGVTHNYNGTGYTVEIGNIPTLAAGQEGTVPVTLHFAENNQFKATSYLIEGGVTVFATSSTITAPTVAGAEISAPLTVGADQEAVVTVTPTADNSYIDSVTLYTVDENGERVAATWESVTQTAGVWTLKLVGPETAKTYVFDVVVASPIISVADTVVYNSTMDAVAIEAAIRNAVTVAEGIDKSKLNIKFDASLNGSGDWQELNYDGNGNWIDTTHPFGQSSVLTNEKIQITYTSANDNGKYKDVIVVQTVSLADNRTETTVNLNANVEIPFYGVEISNDAVKATLFNSVTAGDISVTANVADVTIPDVAYKASSVDSWIPSAVNKADTFRATISYAGNSTYAPSSTTVEFEVVEARPSTSIIVENENQGVVTISESNIDATTIQAKYDTKDELLTALGAKAKVNGVVSDNLKPYIKSIVATEKDADGNDVTSVIGCGEYTVVLAIDAVTGEDGYLASTDKTVILRITDGRPATAISWAADKTTVSVSDKAMFADYDTEAELLVAIDAVVKTNGEKVATPFIVNEIDLTNLTFGKYTIKLGYAANDNYQASDEKEVTVIFTDDRKETSLAIKKAELEYVAYKDWTEANSLENIKTEMSITAVDEDGAAIDPVITVLNSAGTDASFPLGAGEYTVRVAFAENNTHKAAEAVDAKLVLKAKPKASELVVKTENIEVTATYENANKEKVTTTVTANSEGSIAPNTTATITVTVVGDYYLSKNIYVKVGDTTTTYALTDTIEIETTEDKVTYTITADVTEKVATKINAADKVTKDAKDFSVSDENVLNAFGVSVTDSTGNAVEATVGVETDKVENTVGTYTVTFSYAGDGTHKAAADKVVTLVVRPATSITLGKTQASPDVSDALAITDIPALFVPTVSDANGNAIADAAQVTVAEIKKADGTVVTGDIITEAGVYTVTLAYAENEVYCGSVSKEATLIVNFATQINANENLDIPYNGNAITKKRIIDAIFASITAGDTTVTTDSSKVSIDGAIYKRTESLDFLGGWTAVVGDTIGGNSLALGAVADTYKVTLKYNGEGYYLGTTKEITFTVSEGRSATVIGWEDTKPAYDDRAKIAGDFATLSDVLAAVTGTIKVDGKEVTDVEPYIALITDGETTYYSKGLEGYGATEYVPLNDFGTYTIYLAFDGNDKYQAATGNITILTKQYQEATLTINDARPDASFTYTQPVKALYDTESAVLDAVTAAISNVKGGTVTVALADDFKEFPAPGAEATLTYNITVAETDAYKGISTTVTIDVKAKPNVAVINVVDANGNTIDTVTGSGDTRVITITPAEESYVADITLELNESGTATSVINTTAVTFKDGVATYTLSNVADGNIYDIVVTFAKAEVTVPTTPVVRYEVKPDVSMATQQESMTSAVIEAVVELLDDEYDAIFADAKDVKVELYAHEAIDVYSLIEAKLPASLQGYEALVKPAVELYLQAKGLSTAAGWYALDACIDLNGIEVLGQTYDLGVYYYADIIIANAPIEKVGNPMARTAATVEAPVITARITDLATGLTVEGVKLALADNRAESTVVVNNAVVTYGASASDIKTAIGATVVANGNTVKGVKVSYSLTDTELDGLNAGTYTAVVSFAGDNAYKASEAEVTITVEKADSDIVVDSKVARYELIKSNGVNVSDMITATPGNDIDRIEFVVGLGLNDADKMEDVNLDTIVYVNLPELIDVDSLPAIAQEPVKEILNRLETNNITVTELKTLMETTLSALETAQGAANDWGWEIAINTEAIAQLISILEQVEQLDGIGEIKVSLTMDKDIVANTSGVYLVGAIVSDANYNTAADIGYLAITPDGQKVTLDFIINDENGLITRPAILSGDYDLGSKVVEEAYKDAEECLHNIYLGVDIYGNVTVSNEASANIGAYTQLAYIMDFGNEMYYAEPIVRAYVVVADTVDVVFANYDTAVEGVPVYQYTYDRTAHGLVKGEDVTVVDKSGKAMPLDDLTIRYIGIEGDGEGYYSEAAPTHAGVYTVIATYVDADQTHVGMGIATMMIVPSMEAEIAVENAMKTYDGNAININSLITSSPDDAAYAVLTAGVSAVSTDSDNDVLNGITGVVNIDFPAKMDKVLQDAGLFKDAYAKGVNVQSAINSLNAVSDALIKVGYESETIAQVVGLLDQLNKDVTVTFYEQNEVNPTDVGAYLVVATILDPDYVPKVAAGLVVIAPEVTEANLYWNMPDANGIVTVPVIANGTYDLGAYSNVDEVTNDIQYLVLSVTAAGKVNLQSLSDTELNAAMDESGVYTELAYFIDDIEASMYYAKPIMRNLLVVPNAVDITFDDANANNIRYFQYDGNAHAMTVASITDQDGNTIAKDRWADNLTITYVGTNLSDGVHYGTNAPVHAGTYTVIATYAERVDGTVQYAGMEIGTIIIAPSVTADVDVASKVVVYNEQPVNVADMISSSPADAKVAILTAGIDVSGDFSADGLEALTGVINIDFPAKVDNVLKLLVPEAYEADGINLDSTIAALTELSAKAEEFTGDELKGVSYIIDVLQRADNATAVTFHDQSDVNNPNNIGTYLVVAAVCDPDYIPTMGVGILSIVPDLDRMQLQWNMTDTNGIITKAVVDDFDFTAIAVNAKEETTVNYLVSGINEADKLVLTFATANDVNDIIGSNGVYTQMAFVPANEYVDATIPVVAPILRTFAVMPNTAEVTFVDANNNNAFLFAYDGTPKAVEAVVDKANATGTLTVTYIGAGKDVTLYHSTTAPSEIGAYKVVATYVERDGGEISCAGMNIATMVIAPGENDFAIDDTTVHYDGNAQFVTVSNPQNTAYIYAVVDDTNNTINIVMSERLTALAKEVKALGELSVAEAKDIAAALKAKMEAGELNAETVAAIGAFATVVDKVQDKVEAAAAEYTVVFNQSNPAKVGTYEVYAMSYAALLAPVFDSATLTIEGHVAGEVVVENEVAATCTEEGSYDEVVYCAVEGCKVELSRETVTVEAKGHEYEAVVTPPTCEKEGYTTYTCECGDSYTADEEAALGHSWNDGEVTTEPTEDAEGVKTYTCGTCGGTKTESIPVVGHSHSYEAVVTPPTCEGKGYTTYTCECGDSYIADEEAALGHTPGEAATENENGISYTVVYCSVCGTALSRDAVEDEDDTTVKVTGVELVQKTLKLVEGAWAYLTAIINPEEATNKNVTWYSKDDGIAEVDSDGKVTAVTTGTTYIFVVTEDGGYEACSEVIVSSATSSAIYVTGIKVNPSALTLTEGANAKLSVTITPENADDQKVYWNTSDEAVATVDNDGNVNAIKAGDATITVTTSDGGYKATCEITVVAQEKPDCNHQWNKGVITTEPTCTEAGVKTFTCTCGATKTEPVKAQGHTEVVDAAKAPTCTATGLTEGKHCSVCNTVIKAQEEDPVLGHRWNAGVVTTPATEKTAGVKTFTCLNDASHTYTETIPALGHTCSYTTVTTTAPTCTEQGYTTYTCKCGHSYKDNYVSALGHTEVIDPAVAATKYATGLTEGKHCSVCGTVLVAQEVVAKLPSGGSGGGGGGFGGGGASKPQQDTTSTEVINTPSGNKVIITTTEKADGTVIQTTTTTNANGTTTSVSTATLKNGVVVINNDANVEQDSTSVDDKFITQVQTAVAKDENLKVVGGADKSVTINAANATTHIAQHDFVQPMSVKVPVDYSVLSNVEHIGHLTLAKVVTNADGTVELIYMGGHYDRTAGTFTAKVDEDGTYILVEKDDLVKIELNIDDIHTRINDVDDELDVPAEINADNRTLVPLRYIAEALGYEIQWEEDGTVTIYGGETTLNMVIGELIPGFDSKAELKDGRTLVPARYIAERLGANVIWDPIDRQVVIVK